MILTKRILRLIPRILVVAIIFCCFAGNIMAQQSKSVTVTVPRGDITISEAFKQIETQTGYLLAFTASKLNMLKRTTLTKEEYTMQEFLDLVLSGTGHTYTLHTGHIIIVPSQNASQTSQGAVVATLPAQMPVVNDKDLKRFVSDGRDGRNTVNSETMQLGTFRYNSPNRVYKTPGKELIDGEVPVQYSTAERWQRSKLAVKANLLYGAVTYTPNLRMEIGLNNRTTLELGANYNGWNWEGAKGDNRKLVHLSGIAEYRYWLCERFVGHFFGLHGFGVHYNISDYEIPPVFDRGFRYEGYAFGGGISYGYAVPLSARLGLEFNIGVGAAYLTYDKYGCDKCDEKIGDYTETYFGPTRAGINLVYIIK